MGAPAVARAGGGWAMAAAAGLALAVGAGGAGMPREGAKNCGIVGVVSSGEKGQGAEGGVVDFLYEVCAGVTCAVCVWTDLAWPCPYWSFGIYDASASVGLAFVCIRVFIVCYRQSPFTLLFSLC